MTVTMIKRRRDDLVSDLTPGELQSLADALSAAAIAFEIDRAGGRLCMPRSRNRVFQVGQLMTVVEEWCCNDDRRRPSLSLVGR